MKFNSSDLTADAILAAHRRFNPTPDEPPTAGPSEGAGPSEPSTIDESDDMVAGDQQGAHGSSGTVPPTAPEISDRASDVSVVDIGTGHKSFESAVADAGFKLPPPGDENADQDPNNGPGAESPAPDASVTSLESRAPRHSAPSTRHPLPVGNDVIDLDRRPRRQIESPSVTTPPTSSADSRPIPPPLPVDHRRRPPSSPPEWGHQPPASREASNDYPPSYDEPTRITRRPAAFPNTYPQQQGNYPPPGYGQPSGYPYPQQSDYPQQGGWAASPTPPPPHTPQPNNGPHGGGQFVPGPDAGGGFTAPQTQQSVSAPTPSGSSYSLHGQRREGPQQGWRAALHKLHIPVGKGAAELAYDHDIARINKVLRYAKTIGIASLKGGVGRTTCAVCIGSTIARHRHQGLVVGLDADHSGSMADRLPGVQESDIKRFVLDAKLLSENDVNAHMKSNAHRLSVLGSSHDPLAGPLSPQEYKTALTSVQKYHLFNIVDMDHSAATPAYEAIMRSLDALVVVTATSLDSANATDSLFRWLRARDLTKLLTRTIVLINHQSPAKPHLDLDATVSHFQNSERLEVLEIPWDQHLAEAGPINLDLLNKSTRRQFVKVAAWLVDQLPAT